MPNDQPVMPRGLRVMRVAVTVMAIGFGAWLAAALADAVPPWLGYSIGGAPVSREVWMRGAAPIFASSAGWFGAGAAGLWARRRWARVCIVAGFATVCAIALAGIVAGWYPSQLGLRAVIQAAVMGAASELYLYHSSAARWFDALHRRG